MLYELLESQRTGEAKAGQRQVGGDLMQSLDLQTGYHGVMRKREERLA